jgi:methylamine dehydrogenase accessory protein MauD
MDLFLASYVLLWIIVVVQGLLLVVVLRQFGEVYLNSRAGVSRDGLAVGDPAPAFTGVATDGSGVRLQDLMGQWLVLVFASPGCTICRDLLPSLVPIERDLGGAVRVFVLLRGTLEETRAYVEATNTEARVVSIGREGIAEQYKVRVSPFVHIVAPYGVIRGKGLVNDRENVEHLLAYAGVPDPFLDKHRPIIATA